MSASRKTGRGRPPAFSYSATCDSGHEVLHCDGVPLPRLAENYDTPLYVYSGSGIRARLRAFDQAFASFPHTICYSVKANSNLSILRLLAGMGCGFDVVSEGELDRVMRVNRSAAKQVVFSGVGKTSAEMRRALKAGILLFNVESESELLLLHEVAAGSKQKAPVALRVNPDVSAQTHPYISTGLRQHKFGVPIGQARELYAKAARLKHLAIKGVSVHIGSQITDVAPFTEALERIAKLVIVLRQDGHSITHVDAGGGLGIAYQNQQPIEFAVQARKYASAVAGPLKKLRVHLLLEPGRSIVGPAGVLLTRVLYRKTNDGKHFLITDAAMNDLLRPSLYSAYHEIVPVEKPTNHQRLEIVDVVGPICESGDFFARDRELPWIEAGDLLALLDAGAYGMSLASNYNSRLKPAEVLVEGKTIRLIRRRETRADLLRGES